MKILRMVKVPGAPVVNYGRRPGLLYGCTFADVWFGEYFENFLDDWY
ncbi:hypothetical protein [Microbulbifer celer]|uniref:Uncharacterized protein n=1 Tax=Microbulbifer celer TaxID=435905 RepID=A0ABW3UBL2_9GAMM|nr:hypothetical protein [Microbulbifer celer]UFN57131.1 hypothetical protein LPW13_16420 [Microbulbifer celer]